MLKNGVWNMVQMVYGTWTKMVGNLVQMVYETWSKMVGNCGKWWEWVGKLWEMIQNICPMMLPFFVFGYVLC